MSFCIGNGNICLSNETDCQCSNKGAQTGSARIRKTCLDLYKHNHKAVSYNLPLHQFNWITLRAVMLKTLSYNNCVRVCIVVSIYPGRDVPAAQVPYYNLRAYRKAMWFCLHSVNGDKMLDYFIPNYFSFIHSGLLDTSFIHSKLMCKTRSFVTLLNMKKAFLKWDWKRISEFLPRFGKILKTFEFWFLIGTNAKNSFIGTKPEHPVSTFL